MPPCDGHRAVLIPLPLWVVGDSVRLRGHRKVCVPLGQGLDEQILCPDRVVQVCLEAVETMHFTRCPWPPPASLSSPIRECPAMSPLSSSFLQPVALLPSSFSGAPRSWRSSVWVYPGPRILSLLLLLPLVPMSGGRGSRCWPGARTLALFGAWGAGCAAQAMRRRAAQIRAQRASGLRRAVTGHVAGGPAAVAAVPPVYFCWAPLPHVPLLEAAVTAERAGG